MRGRLGDCGAGLVGTEFLADGLKRRGEGTAELTAVLDILTVPWASRGAALLYFTVRLFVPCSGFLAQVLTTTTRSGRRDRALISSIPAIGVCSPFNALCAVAGALLYMLAFYFKLLSLSLSLLSLLIFFC